jgi:hypothetical protein
MDETARADAICRILKTTFPDVKTQLRHRNPFELLIATILAAQCTDRQVNAVTGPLFAAYPTPEALAEAPPPAVEPGPPGLRPGLVCVAPSGLGRAGALPLLSHRATEPRSEIAPRGRSAPSSNSGPARPSRRLKAEHSC